MTQGHQPDDVIDDAGTVPDDAEVTAAAEAEGPTVPEAAGDQPAAPAGGDEAGAAEPVDPAADAERRLAERTADLQRLQAEFLNYKRRVERDRDLLRENATYAALTPIVEVLDTIDRARESAGQSGEALGAGFDTVAGQLERTVDQLGLKKFGTAGDPFDPTVHEALSHIGEDPEVTVTTCKIVAKSGFKIGDRVVRAAQVLVVDPPAGAAAPAPPSDHRE